jgi:hypothetical protein
MEHRQVQILGSRGFLSLVPSILRAGRMSIECRWCRFLDLCFDVG